MPLPPVNLTTALKENLVKEIAHNIMGRFRGMVLAYTNDYDIVKYNLTVPLTPSNFETNKHKWQFIELAKYFHNVQTLNRTGLKINEFPLFLNVMYGEGYREPKIQDVSWFSDIQNNGPLFDIFCSHMQEEKDRYQILETSLLKMRFNHKLKTLEDFKEFISPIVTPKSNIVEPPMWNTIGYSPVQRGNRTYTLSIQSFFLVDSVLHLLDNWDAKMQGEPEWDSNVKRLRAYRKIYSHMFPINSMLVRQAINSTMKFPKN